MLNNNALKTSLIFLLIICFVVLMRFFFVSDGLMEGSEIENKMANIICSVGWLCK